MANVRVSRSAIDTRTKCEMRRWYEYQYAGTGLQREGGVNAATIGTHVHSAMSKIIEGQPLEDVAFSIREELSDTCAQLPSLPHPTYVYEQVALVTGLVAGWQLFRMPQILDEYEIVSTEQSFEVDFGIIKVPFRMDAVLRRKDSGKLAVLDFKTVTNLNASWTAKWDHDIQTFMYIEGLERFAGEQVDGIIYEGLIKGQSRKETAEASRFKGHTIQNSPLCYAYRNKKDGSIVTEWPRSYAAWEKVAQHEITQKDCLEYALGVMERDVLFEQFGTTELISPAPSVRRRMMQNILDGEARFLDRVEVAHRGLVDPEGLFVRNPSYCIQYGLQYQCPFYDMCYSSEVAGSPFENGYVPRIDHHAGEGEE